MKIRAVVEAVTRKERLNGTTETVELSSQPIRGLGDASVFHGSLTLYSEDHFGKFRAGDLVTATVDFEKKGGAA